MEVPPTEPLTDFGVRPHRHGNLTGVIPNRYDTLKRFTRNPRLLYDIMMAVMMTMMMMMM